MPGRGPWTPAQRAAAIEDDLTRMADEQRALLIRKELALQAEIRGMEQQYAAHTEAEQVTTALDVLDGQINEQLEALSALLPKPRPA